MICFLILNFLGCYLRILCSQAMNLSSEIFHSMISLQILMLKLSSYLFNVCNFAFDVYVVYIII